MYKVARKVNQARIYNAMRRITEAGGHQQLLGSLNNCKLHCTTSFLPYQFHENWKATHHLVQLYCTSQEYVHQEKDFDDSATRFKLLDSTLSFVKEYGWTVEAIVKGVKSAGYSQGAHGMFKLGGGDLALHFYRTSNEKLYESLRQTIKDQDGKINVNQFIKDAIKERIRMTTEHQANWHEAMAHLSHPYAAVHALSLLAELVDEIWHLVGDQSTDTDWYTQRVILAAIYKASEFFMLQDKSIDFEDTWKFIDRRFEDSHSLSSLISHMTSISLADTSATLSSAFTVGNNILGLRR